MVRKIVFVLIAAGQRKIHSSILKESLMGINNLPPGIAPAKGLFLEEIIY
jgi:tRNA U38,U39,U40 pseudouridine synthase TruA